jgi:transcription-repair coupling factor (superfamily II helicase)
VRFSPVLLPESAQIRLERLYTKTQYKSQLSIMAAGRPSGVIDKDGTFKAAAFGGTPLRDQALLDWCTQLLDTILGPVLQAVLAN